MARTDSDWLGGDGHERLEMGRVLLAIHQSHVDLSEAGVFEEFRNLQLGKAQPDVGIEFAGVLVAVFQQIQNHDGTARLENGESSSDCPPRLLRVMECLSEKSQVDGQYHYYH